MSIALSSELDGRAIFYCLGNFVPYAIKSPPGRMHTPQCGISPRGGVAAARKVGRAPQRLRKELKWACPLSSVIRKEFEKNLQKILKTIENKLQKWYKRSVNNFYLNLCKGVVKMKAVILSGPNDFAPGEIEKPLIGDHDILLEMKRAAICGTDIRILEGTKTKGVRYPSVIGHEICGVISEIGKEVTGYEVGEKVAIANVIPCGSCPSCLSGRENACMRRKAIGYEFNGGFEEYIRIPEIAIKSGNVIKLPEQVSFTAGALIEPLACCIRGLKNAGTGFNDVVLIVGAGPIGLMHMQLAKIAGAKQVIVSEPNPMRRQIALELGADKAVDPVTEDLAGIISDVTGGLGADVIVMAIGVPALVNSTLKLCRRGGTVNLFAGFAGTGGCTIEVNTIHYNEINVNGSTAYKREDYLQAADMVISGKINLDRIATHTYKIEDFQTAYEMCKSGKGLKIIIEP